MSVSTAVKKGRDQRHTLSDAHIDALSRHVNVVALW